MKTGSSSGIRRRNMLVLLVFCSCVQSAITDSDYNARIHHIRHASSRGSRHPGHNSHHVGQHSANRPAADDVTTHQDEVYSWSSVELDPLAAGPQAIELLTPIELSEYERGGIGARGVSELNTDLSMSDQPTGFRPDQQRRAGLTVVSVSRCDQVVLDPRYALCCDGLIYSRANVGGDVRCCGRVAYDATHYVCCGRRDNTILMRRGPHLPSCCADRGHGYEREDCPRPSSGDYGTDGSAIGSVCCRTRPGHDRDVTSGGWQCCLRGERCCERDGGVLVPGFRPACCSAAPSGFRSPVEEDLAAICCARTFERIGFLPECCDRERLRPVCCNRTMQQESRNGASGVQRPIVKCCPATIGYCCDQFERTVPPTNAYSPVLTTVRPPSRYRQQPLPRIPADPAGDQPLQSSSTTSAVVWHQPTPAVRFTSTATSSPAPATAAAAVPDSDAIDAHANEKHTDSSVGSIAGRQVPSCCHNASIVDCCHATASSAAAAGGTWRVASPTCCQSVCCRITHFNYACCERQLQQHRTIAERMAAAGGSRNMSSSIGG